MGPNLVLIVFDTARADAFEPYGAEAGSGPAFRDLASAGSVVSHAVAPCSWTMPSHVSMFGGALPRTLGLDRLPGRGPRSCRPVIESHAERLLPEVLRRNGYRTCGVSANAWVTREVGFATGFDLFHEVRSRRSHQMSGSGIGARLRWDVQAIRSRADDGAAEALAFADEWLSPSPSPFFLFLNLVECHSPYLPPRPYNDLGLLERLHAAEDARRYQTMIGVWQACLGTRDVPEDSLERMRHLYARSIRQLDDWLGTFLGMLEAKGLLDDTLVVVTSDHGENFGEGGLVGHSFSLDERLIRVPLAASDEGVFPINRPFSLAELPLQIASALDIDVHPWRKDELPDGPPVAQVGPLVGADDPRAQRSRELLGVDPDSAPGLTSPLSAATNGHVKLVRDRGQEYLYRLDVDPLELEPVAVDGFVPADLSPVVDEFRAALDGAEARAHAPDVSSGEDDAATADLEERMRLLGYM